MLFCIPYIIYRYHFVLCDSSTIELLANVESTEAIAKECVVEAGEFAFTPTLHEDYKMSKEGTTYTIKARVYVAQVGTTKYESFADAYAAGTEITLLANVGDVTISKACVINAGEYTINITPGEGYGVINNDNTHTIKALPKVYVCISDVAWSKANIHITNSKGDVTTWPGNAMTKDTKAINGKTYYEYTMPALNTTYNFTFNSGGATNAYWKLEITNVEMSEDKYFRLSARGPIEVNPNDVNTFGYTIYVFDQKSKNVAPNLYVWSDSNAFQDTYGTWNYTWGGQELSKDCYYQPANGQNWRHYYYCEIPTSLYTTGLNFIVNKKGKTSDIKPTKIESDIYVGYWYNSDTDNGFWTNSNLSTPITNL